MIPSPLPPSLPGSVSLSVSPTQQLTDLDGEAGRQTQSDEVSQLCEERVGDGHEVDDRHHLLCQGQRVGLAQPHLGFEPGDSNAKHNGSLSMNEQVDY